MTNNRSQHCNFCEEVKSAKIKIFASKAENKISKMSKTNRCPYNVKPWSLNLHREAFHLNTTKLGNKIHNLRDRKFRGEPLLVIPKVLFVIMEW